MSEDTDCRGLRCHECGNAWDNDVLVGELSRVTGSEFEAVDETALMVDPDSGQALQSADPGSSQR